jgi:hypothetical protein
VVPNLLQNASSGKIFHLPCFPGARDYLGNAAVDNIRDKLDELRFGHVIGNLGRKEKREEFFAGRRPATLRLRSSWPARRIGQTLSI